MFWSCVGCIVLTMIVGFAWGRWVTGGTATRMAADAAKQARAELVAAVCVERFLGASDAPAQLAALKEESNWTRDDFIDKGGWTKLPGLDKTVPQAAGLCAERLADASLPPKEEEQATTEAPDSIVQ
jgi:acetyl-CoA acetyltransferase